MTCLTDLKLTTDAGEVRAIHRFDVARLEAYMADSVDGFQGPLNVRQFSGGHSSPTYKLQTPRADYALRRKPPGALLQSAHAVDREFRVLCALHAAGFPVPQPLAFCNDESVLGTIFYVMKFVPGRIFLNPKLPGLANAERAAAYDSINATLAKLHTLDPDALGLQDFGKPGNYIARQIERWSRQYRSAGTQPNADMDRLIDWLPGAVPDSTDKRLIHGDFAFHNVFFAPEATRVVAVVDWELSTTGDPLADITYHAMDWYRPASPQRATLTDMSEAELAAAGIPTLTSYLQTYCDRVGRPGIDNLPFYQAYNLFRTAAITQGVVARARTGTAADPNAAKLAERIPILARGAWQMAQRAGAM
jgi:aminoglycoside phosphotransferase (APT) family kinase protein